MEKKYPFKFLDSYTRDDKAFFFGRQEEIDQLYEMVFQTDLILIYGASGTGKSSLIQCGLAGRFQDHDWLALPIRRGNNLNAALEKALQDAAGYEGDAAGGTEAEDLDWLEQDDVLTPAKAGSPMAQRLRAVYLRHFKPIYLLFDQFEELYILGDKQEQHQFILTVKEILKAEQPAKILLSIREEYLGYLYEFEKQVPQLLRKKLRVEPMNLDKVKAVIKGVGNQAASNVRLQAGMQETIAERIFSIVKGEEKTLSIQLPYLQVYLDKLYLHLTADESRKAEAEITLAAIDQMGDIGNVLRDFLEGQVLVVARQLEQKPEWVWQLLSPFVTLEGTKEPLSLEQLQERLQGSDVVFIAKALEALAKNRILRFREQEQLYEIAHDSLAKQIHEKRSDEEIALLEVQRMVKAQVSLKEGAREYFTEKGLNLMEPFVAQLKLNEEERQWIERSRQEVLRQKQEAEAWQRQELERAQEQAEKEGRLRQEAEQALAQLRNKNLAIFESFAQAAKELIYTLDHAKALEKMKVAVEVDIEAALKKEQLETAIQELLFFFVEGNRRPELAWDCAGLLLQLETDERVQRQLQQCKAEQWKHKAQFESLFHTFAPYQDFMARYYPEMVEVPLGQDGIFDMGSPETEWGRYNNEALHKVKISASYKMATTPVTFFQYSLYCEAKERSLASLTPFWGRYGDHPVVNVNWYDAVEYCRWLNEQYGLAPAYRLRKEKDSDAFNKVKLDYQKWLVHWQAGAKGFRLPTEAEWELAAKAGVPAQGFLFAGSDHADEVAWYWENSGDKPLSGDWNLNVIYDNNCRTHPVKSKKANGLNIFDLSGNVYEWCWDWYSSNYYEECLGQGLAENPLGPQESSEGRVIRGGSWVGPARYCRTAYRDRSYPDIRDRDIGFRLVFLP